MTLFNTDEVAWSKWTQQFEARFGSGAISPNIIQANTVFRPLSCRTQWPSLNQFRRLLVADSIPSYSKANTGSFVATGSRVSDQYEQYLLQLNVNLRKHAAGLDQALADKKLKAYTRALDALRDFEDQARRAWERSVRTNPNKTRVQWEADYQYRDRKAPFVDVANNSYGDYLAIVAAYPPLFAVTKALRVFNDPKSFIKLPMDEGEAQEGAATQDADQIWAEFHKSMIDFSVDDFLANDQADTIIVTEASSQSTTYESRWSGGVSGGGMFWSFGASAAGGTLDQHLRADASRFAVRFRRLNQYQVARKIWYNEGLIRTYCNEVDRNEYWGPRGLLNLIPEVVILGRNPTVEIDTSAATYSLFQNWYTAQASGGFSIGPFSIGGGGSSSSSFTDIRNASSGTTIRIEDQSNQIYVVAVISLRTSDLLDNPSLRIKPELIALDREIASEQDHWERANANQIANVRVNPQFVQ